MTALTPDAIPNCLYKDCVTWIKLQFNMLISIWELETEMNIDPETKSLTTPLQEKLILEQD